MEVIHKIGRRKTAVARLYMSEGSGKFKINKRELEAYFTTATLQYKVKQPLMLTDNLEAFDFVINVYGGGVTGQAEAIRLAISRALCELDPEPVEKESEESADEEGKEGAPAGFRAILKLEGLLTRDPRMVERKKFGQKKARKKFQFSKR